MRQVWWVTGVMLCLSGCASTAEDRFRDYTEDGISMYQQGRYLDARDSFQAALTLKPEDALLMYNLGACYDHLGDAAKAERYYREGLQRSGNHPDCRHSLAVLLVGQNRRPEAVQMVQEWIAREPKLACAYAEDGWLWHQAGDLPRAQARLQQALALDPHDVRALTELGLVYEEMRRPERALALYERALERDPKQTELANRVKFLLAKGAGRPRPDD